MEFRQNNGYQTLVYDFIKFDILVVCPNCAKQAIVKPYNFALPNTEPNDAKVICLHCGYNKKMLDKESKNAQISNNKAVAMRQYFIGAPIDPFFCLPLWLKTDFETHILWAYNHSHLDFLRGHIEAKLRERNGQAFLNRSLGSRLPKWMCAKKNRELLLKKIDIIRNK